MNYYSINKKEEDKDKLKSGIITITVWSAILLFLFIYKITEKLPEKQEVVTRMLINFGDYRNGNGIEEPANQDGSLAAKANPTNTETDSESPKTKEIKPDIVPISAKKSAHNEKRLTGNSPKNTIKSTENSKTTNKKTVATSSNKKTSNSKATTANAKSGNGDGKGNAAIGNLIRGIGTNNGSQGTGSGIGNQGDPLGGDGNGDSKIGIDRRLVGFIPGTEGKSGPKPSHNCTASGQIKITYIVDKAGNVISANRSSGVSDPCVVSTTISWVKRYVKAERANVFSTGTYTITF